MIAMKRLGLMAFLLMGMFSTVKATGLSIYEEHYVQTMVSEVVEHYKNHGAQATFDKLNAGWTLDGQYYVFAARVYDVIILAHAANPALVGKPSSNVVNSEGRYVLDEIVNAATDAGAWIEYKLLNPATKTEGDKRTWMVRIDDYVFGSGYYL